MNTLRFPMKPIRIILLAAALAVPVASCAAIVSALPAVIAAVQDGMLVLDAIDSFVENVFKVRPNADFEKKVDAAIARTRLALDTALRLSQGTEKLTQAQLDAAFNEFRIAYQDLVALVAPLGVTAGVGDSLRATPGGLQVPEPLAFRLKV